MDEVKSNELTNFISGNVVLEDESKLAGFVSFQANTEIVYADKLGLKKKRKVFVLWPYASSIAAASVVVFFMSIIDDAPISVDPVRVKTVNTELPNGNNHKIVKHDGVHSSSNSKDELRNSINSININQVATVGKGNKIKQKGVDKIKSNPAGPIATINEQKLAPIGTRYSNPTNTANQNKEVDVLALSPKSEMHNPIEPLTKFVSKKTNTEIDFKTTEKVEDERRGFHLKIGKFEISRNKRR